MLKSNMNNSPKIAFVRGTGRCGSKTLANQLGLHPQINKIPANECLPEELMDFNDHHVRARCVNATDESLVSACCAYFDAYCSSSVQGNGLALHKSTMNAHRLASLLSYWPEAKIIYIVRHPIGVVEALIRADINQYKGAHGRATVANSLLRWANDVLTYLRSPAFNNPNLLQVKFEEMISDTDEFFKRIYRFLEIDHSFTHNLPKPDKHDDTFRLSDNEKRWIIDSTSEILRKLGYESDEDSVDSCAEVDGFAMTHPDRRLTAKPPAIDGVQLLRIALDNAAENGVKRVGLFGAGYLSRLISPYLSNMPVEIVCFLDENPSLVGSKLSGIPIIHPNQAAMLDVEAVIPMTMIHQQALIEKWQRMFEDRIPILELWPENKPETICV